MFDIVPGVGWVALAYVLGSIVTYSWGYKRGVMDASDKAIDALMDQGIIKWSRDSNGDIQIHKWNE